MIKLKVKKILLMCTIMAVVSLGLVGCDNISGEGNVSSNVNNTENNVVEDNASVDKENINDSEENKDDLDDKDDKDDLNDKDDLDDKEEEKFIIYSMDVMTDEEIIVGEVDIDKDETLEERVSELAKELSDEVFSDLPLELVEIKDVDGKKVALFNLDETGKNAGETPYQDYEGVSWFNNYFAGSAGGRITEYTLEQTLLQRDYVGEWIDGIEFTYKGQKIEFDHVPGLSEVMYR